MRKSHTLYHGEALKVLKKLAEKGIKVDAIICDPPFGTTNCAWDVVIPFKEMWEALEKVSKDNTPTILFGTEPFSSSLRLSNLEMYKYDWTWVKSQPTGHLNAKKQPLRVVENISVFYKGGRKYFPIKTNGHVRKQVGANARRRAIVKGNVREGVYGRGREEGVGGYDSCERYPLNVLYYSRDTQKGAYHPTQKPLELMRYLVKTYTEEGDLVLDFTCGSGTTLVACVLEGRRSIGIEKVKRHFKTAKRRLKEAKKYLRMRLF